MSVLKLAVIQIGTVLEDVLLPDSQRTLPGLVILLTCVGCGSPGRVVRACLGTTKYCNAFLKGVPCNSKDCLYLHSVGTIRSLPD